MTKEFPTTNIQPAAQKAVAGSSFGLGHSLVIMVSSLVIFPK
jgi:hypothetical protein